MATKSNPFRLAAEVINFGILGGCRSNEFKVAAKRNQFQVAGKRNQFQVAAKVINFRWLLKGKGWQRAHFAYRPDHKGLAWQISGGTLGTFRPIVGWAYSGVNGHNRGYSAPLKEHKENPIFKYFRNSLPTVKDTGIGETVTRKASAGVPALTEGDHA